jgi:hypothetical protein
MRFHNYATFEIKTGITCGRKDFHRKGIQRKTIIKEEGFIIEPLMISFDRTKTVTTGLNLEHLTIYGRPLVAKRLGC